MYQNRNNELEIIDLYRSDYKSRFYLRQISKLSKIPLKTCQNVLNNLEKIKVLKSKIEGKNKYFSLNLDNIKTKSYLLQSEIHKMDNFLLHYPQFKTFLKSINLNTPLILFGSFAKLNADKNSDVDLMVISGKTPNLDFHLIPYKFHCVNLSEETFQKALKEKETLIEEIKDNHIILNNHSFYITAMWDYYGKN